MHESVVSDQNRSTKRSKKLFCKTKQILEKSVFLFIFISEDEDFSFVFVALALVFLRWYLFLFHSSKDCSTLLFFLLFMINSHLTPLKVLIFIKTYSSGKFNVVLDKNKDNRFIITKPILWQLKIAVGLSSNKCCVDFLSSAVVWLFYGQSMLLLPLLSTHNCVGFFKHVSCEIICNKFEVILRDNIQNNIRQIILYKIILDK